MFAWSLLLLALSVTPSRADYERALQVAVELEQAGSFDAAVRQFEVVRLLAPPEERRSVGRRICYIKERALGDAAAQACYAELNEPLAQLRAIELLNEAEQPQKLIELIAQVPDSDVARRALVRLIAILPQPEQALLRVATLVKPSDDPREWSKATRTLLANVWVEIARLSLEQKNSTRTLEVLDGAQIVISDTVWQDDALFMHAQAAEQSGNAQQALADYTRLIDSRERSLFIGSYDSTFYDDAFLAKTRLLLRLGRHDEAREVVKEMKQKTPMSRLLDDAQRLIGMQP